MIAFSTGCCNAPQKVGSSAEVQPGRARFVDPYLPDSTPPPQKNYGYHMVFNDEFNPDKVKLANTQMPRHYEIDYARIYVKNPEEQVKQPGE